MLAQERMASLRFPAFFGKKFGCQGADFWVDCCLAADAMFGELWYVSRCTAVFRVLFPLAGAATVFSKKGFELV